jgi:polyisoprenoid-binding protein YceI
VLTLYALAAASVPIAAAWYAAARYVVVTHFFGGITVLKPLAAALALAVRSPPRRPGDVHDRPYHTFPNFTVDHLGVSTLYGHFTKSSGKITVDRAAKTGSMEIVSTPLPSRPATSRRARGPRTRDEHLRTADFFNVASFQGDVQEQQDPVLGRQPERHRGRADARRRHQAAHAHRRALQVPAGVGNAKERCGGNATGKFKRTDFGMKFGVPNVGDEIALMVEFEALKGLTAPAASKAGPRARLFYRSCATNSRTPFSSICTATGREHESHQALRTQ